MSDKTNGKLYKINTIHKDIKSFSFDRKIETIINSYNSKRTKKELEEGFKFSNQKIKSNFKKFKGYNVTLYTLVTPKKPPVWKTFLDSISDEKNDDLESVNSSFLLFIYDESEIYVLSRGYHGIAVIKDFIVNSFGIDIISCLLEVSKTEIKSLNERKFFGDEIFAQRIFRENFVLSYDDNFGKIYDKVIADIGKKNFTDLGVENKRKLEKVSVDVGDYIEISSVFNFNELINRISSFSKLLKETTDKNKSIINHFKLITQTNTKLIENLNVELFNKCFLSYNIKNVFVDFYFKDIMLLLNSKKLQIIDKENDYVYLEAEDLKSLNLNLILDRIKDKISFGIDDFYEVMNFLNFKLYYEINGVEYTESTNFIDWINIEINFEDKDYFRIDGLWYMVQNDLKNYISRELDLMFENAQVLFNLNKWEKTINENTGNPSYLEANFNNFHKEKSCFIVADKCTYNGVELADLIYIDEDKIKLYHVKKGIAGELRVLASQVINSARTIRHENRNTLLKKYFKTIKQNQYDDSDVFYLKDGKKIIIDENLFLSLFKNKKIEYVFAISKENNKNEDLKKIIKTGKSRIAKLSMINVYKEIKKFDFELSFELIEEI
jgi:uncharacterized protein (TIGR04141 family)